MLSILKDQDLAQKIFILNPVVYYLFQFSSTILGSPTMWANRYTWIFFGRNVIEIVDLSKANYFLSFSKSLQQTLIFVALILLWKGMHTHYTDVKTVPCLLILPLSLKEKYFKISGVVKINPILTLSLALPDNFVNTNNGRFSRRQMPWFKANHRILNMGKLVREIMGVIWSLWS